MLSVVAPFRLTGSPVTSDQMRTIRVIASYGLFQNAAIQMTQLIGLLLIDKEIRDRVHNTLFFVNLRTAPITKSV